jgi:hypothetical protein
MSEQIFELVEAFGPERAVVCEPTCKRRKPLWTGTIDCAAPFAAVSDEAAAAQDCEMLRDGGLRDWKSLSKHGDGAFATGELLEDGQTCGIG